MYRKILTFFLWSEIDRDLFAWPNEEGNGRFYYKSLL